MNGPGFQRDPLTIGILIATLSGFWPLGKAWFASRRLPLRAALTWALVALGLAAGSQAQALFELSESGRPLANQWLYLANLAGFAAMISVFNARTPGGGAWAILMGLLVLVFLVPWLEGSGLAKGGGAMNRLRLEMPWSLFFGLVAVAGVTNFLPTFYGPAAAMLGTAFALEFAGLMLTSWPAERRGEMWSVVPVLMAGTCWMARFRSRKRIQGNHDLTRLWLWFRDHWGVIWAMRVQDRFNQVAKSAAWPLRMSWQGPRGLDGGEALVIPIEAQETLVQLLGRFAPEDVLKSSGKNPKSGASLDSLSG